MPATQRPIAVPPALTPYVEAIDLQATAATNPLKPYQVLPGLNPVLGFQYRGRLAVQRDGEMQQLALGGITGLQSQVRVFVPDGLTASVLVRFTPIGAYALLGCDMNELADQHVALADVAAGETNIPQQLAEAKSDAVATVIGWLARLHERRRDVHADLIDAVGRIRASGGGVPIERIADQIGVGRRQLERLFRLQVGVSPKEFASVTRFTVALGQMSRGGAWADIAAAAGYADQAHFIRNFRRRTGRTPGDFQRQIAGQTP